MKKLILLISLFVNFLTFSQVYIATGVNTKTENSIIEAGLELTNGRSDYYTTIMYRKESGIDKYSIVVSKPLNKTKHKFGLLLGLSLVRNDIYINNYIEGIVGGFYKIKVNENLNIINNLLYNLNYGYNGEVYLTSGISFNILKN